MVFANRPVTLGWFAYAPLPGTTSAAGAALAVHPGAAWGVAAAAVGAVIVSGTVGYARGRRDGERASSTDRT